jgi:hypothetical protein
MGDLEVMEDWQRKWPASTSSSSNGEQESEERGKKTVKEERRKGNKLIRGAHCHMAYTLAKPSTKTIDGQI